jgi:hypothetical protein
MPAYLAKYWKKMMGADFLIQGGRNLAEAEAEFGKDWLAGEDQPRLRYGNGKFSIMTAAIHQTNIHQSSD